MLEFLYVPCSEIMCDWHIITENEDNGNATEKWNI
jgi:hypothetical protein